MLLVRMLGFSFLLGASLLGCGHSATGPAGLPTKPCDEAAQAAAGASPSPGPAQQDAVLRACISQPDLEAAGSKYPGIFTGGDTVTVATARCGASDGPSDAPLCRILLAMPSAS